MKNCKVCKVEFTPKSDRFVTCGDYMCIRKNSGAYVKINFKRIDHKGFESLVRRVRSSLSVSPLVTVIYVKEEGFKVLKSITDHTAKLLDLGYAVKVGDYVKSVPTQYLIEDFVDMVDEIALGEKA